MVQHDIAAFYSLNEAVHWLWRGGVYADGTTLNMSSGEEVIQTKPLITTAKHEPLLTLLNPKFTSVPKGTTALNSFWRESWQDNCIQQLKAQLSREGSALRTAMQQVEIAGAMLITYTALLCPEKIAAIGTIIDGLTEERLISGLFAPSGISHLLSKNIDLLKKSCSVFLQTLPKHFIAHNINSLLAQLNYLYAQMPAWNQAAKQRRATVTAAAAAEKNSQLQQENIELKQQVSEMQAQITSMSSELAGLSSMLRMFLQAQPGIQSTPAAAQPAPGYSPSL